MLLDSVRLFCVSCVFCFVLFCFVSFFLKKIASSLGFVVLFSLLLLLEHAVQRPCICALANCRHCEVMREQLVAVKGVELS